MNEERRQALLVESDAAKRAMVAEAFAEKAPEMALQAVDTLAAAREAVEESLPDIIMCNWFLSDGAGAELLPGDLGSRILPIIMMCDRGREEMAVEALKAGALDYIVITEQTLCDLPRTARRCLREWDHVMRFRAAEQQLRDHREFLKRVIDKSPSLVYVKDWDGRYTMVNRAFAELLGAQPEQMVGKTDSEIHSEWVLSDFLLKRDQDVITSGKTRVIPKEAFRDAVTQEERWFKTVIGPVETGEGRPLNVIAFSEEITDRKQTEDALAREAGLGAAMADAINLFNAGGDTDDLIDLVMDRALQLTDSLSGLVLETAGPSVSQPGEWTAGRFENEGGGASREEVADAMREVALWGVGQRKPLTVNDPLNDPHLEGAGLESESIQRFVTAPIIAHYRVLGQVVLCNGEREYARHDAVALERLGNMLALAIQRRQGQIESQGAQKEIEELQRILSYSATLVFRMENAENWPILSVTQNIDRYGYRASDLKKAAMGFAHLVYSEDLMAFSDEMARCAWNPGAKTAEFEFRLMAQNGKPVWMDARLWSEKNAEGELDHYYLILNDISTRTVATEGAGTGAADGVEHAEHGQWDWDLKKGQLTVDPLYEHMLGYETGELTGGMDALVALIHPEDKSKRLALLDRHLKGMAPNYRAEYRIRSQNGNWVWVLDRGNVKVREADGTPTRMSGTLINISEMKQATDLKRKHFRQFHAFFDNAPFGVCVYDMEGSIEMVNKRLCRSTGFREEELFQQPLSHLLDRDTLARIHNDPSAVQRMAGAPEVDGQIMVKGGESRPAKIKRISYMGEDGEPRRLLYVLTDIQEQP